MLSGVIVKSWMAWLFLALLAVTLTLPVSLNGYLTGHDYHLHLKWATHFITQFWMGDLYPRWLIDMNAGQGSPVFFFYGPAAYWFTAMLPPWSGGSVEEISQQLGYSTLLAVFLSGGALYLWLRREVGTLAALAGATAYMVLPYHVLVDVYTRFAFSELWAFVWLPLLLLFSDRIIRGEPYGLCGFAMAYALLVMTHLPSALICSAIPALYMLVRVHTGERLKVLVMAAAYLFGLALAMVYLLPALTMQSYVDMSKELWTGFYDATANFLFYGPRFSGNDAHFWTMLSQVSLISGGAGLLAGMLAWRVCSKHVILFWVAMLLLALFMMHPWSAPVWHLIKTLQAVQFPWRFNVALTFTAAVLCAYGAQALFLRPVLWRSVVAVAILCFLVVLWPSNVKPMLWNSLKPFHPPAQVMQNYFDADEYRPISVPKQFWLALQKSDLSVLMERPAYVAEGEGRVELLSWKPRDIRLQVMAGSEVKIVVRQFYFPGWTAALDGQQTLRTEVTQEGWLSVRLPQGMHHLQWVLSPLPVELTGRWISGVAVVALILTLLATWFGWRFRAFSPRRA